MGYYALTQILVDVPIKHGKLNTVLKDRLKMLLELEAYHAQQLAHVRAMLAAERGQPIEQEERNGAAESDKPFSQLTRAHAVTEILKKKGDMHFTKIFASMKRRGHPIKSKNALTNMLSTDDRFEKKGKGIWALSENEKSRNQPRLFSEELA